MKALAKTIMASAAAVALAGAAASANAATLFIDSAGIYDPTVLDISGAGAPVSAKATAIDLQVATVDGGKSHTVWAFCVDLFHRISAGTGFQHDVDLSYHTTPIKVDSHGTTSGVDGMTLSATQIGEIGGLVAYGDHLISIHGADLGDNLAEIQGAIWTVEYPGYTFTATGKEAGDIQAGIGSYVKMASSPGFATRSALGVYDVAGKGQGFGGVPEPGAWVLMIGGLALCGGMLRRRRLAMAA